MKGTQTSKQMADLEEKRTLLRNQIQRWRQAQLAYTPCVASLIVQPPTDLAELPPMEPAESMPLYLPSSLPQHLRELPELATVLEKECRLRVAQADDALAEIRCHRRIISGLWQFKKINIDGTGNKASTRMRTLYNRFNFRTQRCAGCYRAARNALLLLDPNGDWQSRLKDLKDNDIRGPGKNDNGSGNGRFEPSWIWLVPRVHSAPDMGDSEQVLDDNLQVEWAKVQARKQRWEEEVLLIQEEMRRVVLFYEWKAHWWQSQAHRRKDGDQSIIHGVAAYAKKQAHLCECLAQSCITSWLPELKDNDITSDWKARYPTYSLVSTIVFDETPTNGNKGDYDGNESVEEAEDSEDEKEECSKRDNSIDIDYFEIED